MKLIYIPIEIKARELVSKLLFIAENINEKFVFFIGDKMATKNAILTLGKGVYFYKSINWYDAPHINRVKSKGNKYVSQDEESGATQSNQSNFRLILNRRSSEQNLSLVDKVFTWGDFDQKGWHSRYYKYKKKIIKTGSPRIDLWREKIYVKIFEDEISYLKKYSPFIFIPSTFVSSNNWLKKLIKLEEKTKKAIKNESITFTKKRIDQYKHLYKGFLGYVKLIKKLSIDFPNHKILVKPKPEENINDWKKKFNQKKYSNIVIDNKFELTAYIAASECVIFIDSTAGIQSAIMGKKTISYNPSNLKSLRNFANKCVPNAKNYKTLKKFIKQDIIKEQLSLQKKINKRFYISKKTSSKIIMKHIKKIEFENINMNFFNYKINLLSIYFFLIDNIKFFLNDLKNIIFNNSDFKSYSLKMQGGIKKKEVQKIFKKLNILNKTKIIRFGKNGYIIYKKNT